MENVLCKVIVKVRKIKNCKIISIFISYNNFFYLNISYFKLLKLCDDIFN